MTQDKLSIHQLPLHGRHASPRLFRQVNLIVEGPVQPSADQQRGWILRGQQLVHSRGNEATVQI